jgi:murein DD-endopeptidase MepM/ murein hydrolase activator NlpD
VIYQPDNHAGQRKSGHRQAVRRASAERFRHDLAHREFHWHERPLPTPWYRKAWLWTNKVAHALRTQLASPTRSQASSAGAKRWTMPAMTVAILALVGLPVSASLFNGNDHGTLSMSLALPPQSSLVGVEARANSTAIPNLKTDLYIAGVNDDQWQIETVRRNETVGDIFSRLDLSANDLHRVIQLSPETQELVKVFPGEQIAFKLQDGKLKGMQFDGDEAHRVLLSFDSEQISQKLVARKMESRVTYASATIEHSLFGSGNSADMSDAVIIRLANAFNYDIDFAQDLQPGDSFAVAYEQVFRDGEKLRDGDIVAASFVNQGKRYEIYRFVDDQGRVDYLSVDGRSRKKAFIRTPVEFTRISSTFTPNRRHPILGRMQRHMGVDYAAPTGTPIVATGNAVVKSAGWYGGYGNAVVLQHKGGIETLYGHMTRFAKGVSKGSKIAQGEVIGYVGSTGMSTGPHLHYEFRIAGVHRDPLSVDLPVADPLSGAEMARFKASTAPLLARLKSLEARLASSK